MVAFKFFTGEGNFPAVFSLTGKASGPGRAVFALRTAVLYVRKLKHRSGLQVPTRTKQLVRFPV
ncbi:hypothetical protein [Candidatus Avelusimicrobium sp.]|uniref:hypothetical protein n=1 Tax=Candidatus Avelusimicrobium sp. TaxID=3048833 RepID=UPI003D7D15C1